MHTRLHGPAALGAKHATGKAALLKQMIHVLQAQLVRLGEEAVDDGDPEGAEDGEDDEGVPGDAGDCYGCYLHDGEYAPGG